jgi:hypothetical protein
LCREAAILQLIARAELALQHNKYAALTIISDSLLHFTK